MALTEASPQTFDGAVDVRDFVAMAPENQDNINQIVRWSVRESMIAMHPASVKAHNFAKAAFDASTDTILGYAAITHIYSAQVVELGGLVVHEATRGRGIASKVIRAVVENTLENMNPLQIIAFSNKTSAPIFAKLGGMQIEDALTLPSEVWKVCHTCRFFDEAEARGDRCCGRVYDITTINDGVS